MYILMSGKQIIAIKSSRMKCVASAQSPLRELFVTWRLLKRDKSRSYTVRQITTLSWLVEDTKLKRMFLVTLTIFGKK